MGIEILSQQQKDMIVLLIEGENISAIAKRIGIARQTVYEWMKKPIVKAEMDRLRQDLIHQGNAYIMKDVSTYIANIKALANDKSDKRVCLAANQYLLNRIYGNPTNSIEIDGISSNEDSKTINEIESELSKYKKQIKLVK